MPRERWKLTREAVMDVYGDPIHLSRETPSLLSEMARDPSNCMVEVEPGIYHVRRSEGESGR